MEAALQGTAESPTGSRATAPAQNKVAIITGASSGIGRAVAVDLATSNYDIVLVALEKALLQDVEQELANSNIRTLVSACDVTDVAQVRDTIQLTLKMFGRIDVLVNAAGYAVYGPFETMRLEDIYGQMLTNYFGIVLFIKECIVELKRNGGVIVNIASTSGLMGFPRLAAYVASKHAVVGLSEALKYELDGTGVSVCVIAPGKVKTNIFAHPSFSGVRWAHDDSGIAPSAVAREIARAIAERKSLYIVPRSRKIALFLKRILPESIVSRKMKDT